MNIIDQVEVKGFWGTHTSQLKCFDDFNFLIGSNGSGKTTLLNIIAGVLQADKYSLSRYEFDSVRILLKDPGSRKRPAIEVIRDNDAAFFSVNYKIFGSASEKPFSYELSDVEGFDNFSFSTYQIRRRLAGTSAASKTLKAHLDELVRLTWLSVQRSTVNNESVADPIDVKIEDISNRLVRYLSAIGKQVNRLHERFQEQLFLSLLSEDFLSSRLTPDFRMVDKNKTALLQIYSQFQIDEDNFAPKVERHFEMARSVHKKLIKKQELSPDDIMTVLDFVRIDRSVEFWEIISAEKHKLLAPREKFLSLLNELMQRKTISLNERNEMIITSQSGKALTLPQLSSGEKQIIIILAEALLQEGRTFIYMADEPELSLHLAWQETLATNLKSLNPSAQIIFATHSPDVVGRFSDNIIQMENCIE